MFILLKPVRILLQVIPACLALLLAPTPGAAGAQSTRDLSLLPFEQLGQPLKLARRAAAPELSALEEFGLDNDTEQHLKASARISRLALPLHWPERSDRSSYRAPLRPYRCCAAPPTGPPHA